jgi:hypothetical protein
VRGGVGGAWGRAACCVPRRLPPPNATPTRAPTPAPPLNPRSYPGTYLFVDECHATGFLGATGRGTDEACGVRGRVDIINSTLGKALGGATGEGARAGAWAGDAGHRGAREVRSPGPAAPPGHRAPPPPPRPLNAEAATPRGAPT